MTKTMSTTFGEALAATHLNFIIVGTWLIIVDKNKLVTRFGSGWQQYAFYISQSLTSKCSAAWVGTFDNVNQARLLVRPRSVHTWEQKLNPSRETVPLRSDFRDHYNPPAIAYYSIQYTVVVLCMSKHCKKKLAGMSLIKLSLGGNNQIIPAQGGFGKWRPGWGRECRNPFLRYSSVQYSTYIWGQTLMKCHLQSI